METLIENTNLILTLNNNSLTNIHNDTENKLALDKTHPFNNLTKEQLIKSCMVLQQTLIDITEEIQVAEFERKVYHEQTNSETSS